MFGRKAVEALIGTRMGEDDTEAPADNTHYNLSNNLTGENSVIS